MQLTIENGELKIKIEYDCRGAALLRLLLAPEEITAKNIIHSSVILLIAILNG